MPLESRVPTPECSKSPEGSKKVVDDSTPTLPYKEVLKIMKKHYRDQTPTRSKSPSRCRRSLRLNAIEASEPLPSFENPNTFNNRIRRRMIELQNLDTRKLRHELSSQPSALETPAGADRPIYNLMNASSVNRKYVDDMAEEHLEGGTMPGESELQKEEGARFLQRVLFTLPAKFLEFSMKIL
ncbi:unnamed protein product [Bursaphelenchus xylophilus]|uniref:(pine wood nematode) hypothetical protein n=1 Tax=Bursaphelenchus xylophilus TaxID=6326 RepID=A0A1I7S7P7_BURXY|nr:unnamed protein product [Bursaphelenchus xylophilus]CAG9086828.1 unnamed protein product [Bursaphelenchus xylophilus]